MLIVEGPDCAGKTYLCRELVKKLPGWTYQHLSRLQDAFDRYWGYVERTCGTVVQDRFHLSELAYARARGDVTPLTEETYRLVDAEVRRAGGFTVMILPSDDLVRRRWDAGQMYQLPTVLRAAEAFRRARELFPWADVDLEVRCDDGKPYADERDVDEVLRRYRARLAEVEAIGTRRPVRL